MSLFQLFPDLVQALRPPSGLPPLLQWRRSGHRARLLFQHVEIMFQVENLVTATVAALMPRDAFAIVLDIDARGPDASGHTQTSPERRRIPVGLHFDSAVAVHHQREQNLVN